MLVNLAEGVRQQLDQISRLEIAKEQVQNITNTAKVLQDLKVKITELRHFCQLLDGLLAEQLQPVMEQVQTLTGEVEASWQKFAGQPPHFGQADSLKKLLPKLQALEKGAQTVWKSYATTRIGPTLELWQLVRSLPEIQPRVAELEDYIAKLKRYAGIVPPTNSQDLAEFENTLAALSTALSNVTGLDEEVKAFLVKVSSKIATMADLTSVVLEWLQKGERAQSFQISFSSK